MHLYKTMKSFLFDKDYFIDVWDKCIHVFGFIDIDVLEEQKISLVLEHFKIEILGQDFRVLKLTKKEILIEGNLNTIKVIR